MELIKTRILQYLDHFQDIDYLAQIVNSISVVKLFNIIDELLKSEDSDKVRLTCNFIQDLVLLAPPHPDCKNFGQDFLESSIITTLEELVFSSNHFTRNQVIYTLGKTSSYRSIPALNQAFNKFLDTDPILLPRLVFEMGWLGAENFRSLVDPIISSPIFMTRWAVISMLPGFFGDDAQDELFPGRLRCLEQLRGDSNPLIQAEAEYEYQLLKFRSNMHNLPKADRKKQLKLLGQQYKPVYCFDHMSMMFENYLYTKEITEYSIDDLVIFISNITQSRPIQD
jgi:hypothetical protein